jgi:hypothetical protein
MLAKKQRSSSSGTFYLYIEVVGKKPLPRAHTSYSYRDMYTVYTMSRKLQILNVVFWLWSLCYAAATWSQLYSGPVLDPFSQN